MVLCVHAVYVYVMQPTVIYWSVMYDVLVFCVNAVLVN